MPRKNGERMLESKSLSTSRCLKLWRKRRAKESGTAFTQEMAAAELRIPVGTYIGWEQAYRTPRSAAYQYLLEKTQPIGFSSDYLPNKNL